MAATSHYQPKARFQGQLKTRHQPAKQTLPPNKQKNIEDTKDRN
jgi:hypothetical protein